MKRETIRRHHLSRIQKMKGIKIPMIQDIYPHKLHNEYNPSARVQESSPILNISNGKVLVHTEQFDNGIVAFPMKNRSVSIPSSCKERSTSCKAAPVHPLFRELPLISNTFIREILLPLLLCSVFHAVSTACCNRL